MKKYDLDEETQFLLEEVLSWAQTIVDMQMDSETQEEMQYVITDLADRMHIEYHRMQVEESINEHGETVMRIVVEEKEKPKPKPHLTVVQSDLED